MEHLEALPSKRGAEPPDDVLGAFTGGSSHTQEDEMQHWWGARTQAELAREVLGEETWGAAGQEEGATSTEL